MSRQSDASRVVATGLGIVSCLGNDLESVERSLRAERSGIQPVPQWRELGIKSQIAGTLDLEERIASSAISPRRLETMGPPARYAVLAAESAIAQAALSPEQLASDRCACIVGSGVGALTTVYEGAVEVHAGRPRRVRPFAILQGMSSSCSAHVTQTFGIGGRSYSLSSACASSTHAIGHAFELLRARMVDVAVVGGSEAVDAIVAGSFAALRGALSTGFNDRPQLASRPFDVSRDGFVLSSGGGALVLETREHARARGARALVEIAGFGANSDGHDIVQTEPEGVRAAACMRAALADAGIDPREVDYVNAHATSTPIGDDAEIRALRAVFGSSLPRVSSTKSLNGHSLGAAGVHELAHCVAMMHGGFLAACTNLEQPSPENEDVPFVRSPEAASPAVVLSNSFGFGGTNASLVLRAPES